MNHFHTADAGFAATLEPTTFDIDAIRRDFPILQRRVHGKPLVYLDNAATTQKPRQVIEAITGFYTETNSNVHRGLHTLADESTRAYEETRKQTAEFIGAEKPEEIVFTSGATEAINLVAWSWGMKNVGEGDEILLTEMEHHANLLPWIVLAKRTGARLKYIPVNDEGLLEMTAVDSLLTSRTKLLAFTAMSNVLGTINPVAELSRKAHTVGAKVLLDGAQSVPHLATDVAGSGADFLVFSAHKMLGPTGVGVLYGREELFAEMGPFHTGGEMMEKVEWETATWADPPHRFEAGTPNIAGVAAFAESLRYLRRFGMDKIRRHEYALTSYALERLQELDFLRILGPLDPNVRGGAVSFVSADGMPHPHDMAQILDNRGIAVRAGHHCAQPLHRKLGLQASARASFYLYNTFDEVDLLVEGLLEARDFFA